MKITGTYIDQTELLEYWRMSNAFETTRYKRLLWSASRYAEKYGIPRIKAYKALDYTLV